ncbi:hypothetical protein AWC38_SpisGene23896 [Stylophora pistillata]|uniref:Uncharacterized protein n=1 Tax=Stylophora pistillata TaxID=50429 RepID=A0A2B4R1D8_STYPI|nr:hypothetical protein AWC38_SpisGene23896 [Stylophora pistillata]
MYDENSVQTLPPFRLSDYNLIILCPKTRPVREDSLRKQMSRRDTGASRKLELGRYFCGIDWSLLERTHGCAAKLQLFMDVVETGLDIIMPVKKSKIHARDAPSVSLEFKDLVKLRKNAFSNSDVSLFHYYRNGVNREGKALHGRFYASKVNQLMHTNPSQKWNSVKRIAGMIPATDTDTVTSCLQIEGTESLSEYNIANMINAALVEPLECFERLEFVPTPEVESTLFTIPESSVFFGASKVEPLKNVDDTTIAEIVPRRATSKVLFTLLKPGRAINE